VSLVFCDSFALDDLYFKWGSSTGSRSTSSPRRAGGVYLTGAANLKRFPASAEVYVHAAVRFTGTTTTAVQVIGLHGESGLTQHLGIIRNSSQKLEIRRGNSTAGTLLATGTTTIANGTWMVIEVHAKVADSGGVCEVRIGGNPTNEVSFTGDTRNGGAVTTIDKLTVGWTTIDATDVVICDALGSAANTWLGDRTVERILPAGAGNWTQGSPNTVDDLGHPVTPPSGPSHWTLLDETSLVTQSADYLDLTVGQAETVTFTDPTFPGAVAALQVCAWGASIGPTAQIKGLARVGGTDYLSAAAATTDAVATTVLPFDRNPATSTPWSNSAVNALEAGVQQQSDGSSGYRLLALYAEIVVETVASGVGVEVHGGGTITVAAAPISAGTVTVSGGGTISTVDLDTDTGRPLPADPELTIPDLPVLRRESLTWPAPTLVDGVPVEWEPA
jgi:hypothetical protein